MFTAPRQRTMLGAAMAQLGLIYTVTVHNLRSKDRNPILGLLMSAVQSAVMIGGFVATFYLLGVKRSPLRGDFLLYMMSGIFLYQAHTMACAAVVGSGSSASPIMKHGPMNTAVVISAAALAALYRILFSIVLVMGVYWLIKPFQIERPVECLGLLMLAWFSGAAFGLVFLSIKPWSPKAVQIGSQVYNRVQMLASGKMFVANALPAFMLHYFDWNPLFHMIDQIRGDVFINYTPHHSNMVYPIYFTLAVMMVGLMGEFVTRRSVSLSWTAGH